MRFFQKILLLFLLFFIAIFFAEKINLTNSDIGRHVKNGEVFTKDSKIISTNFYSYTEPKFPVINHHWGAGVIFYKIWKLFKFDGLSFFNILLNTLAFLLFFLIAFKHSGFGYAFVLSLLCVPIITTRIEIRPESFSCLLLGIYYLLISNYFTNKANYKKLYILPLLQLLWVNLHIFFILGIFIIGVYWLNNILVLKDKKSTRHLSIVLILTLIASLINPYGLKGLIEPFFIFKEYGYMVAENQSIPFMQDRFPSNSKYILFEFLIVVTIISFVLLRKKIKNYIPEILIALFFILISLKINRVMNVWGLFFIPIVSKNFYNIEKNTKFITAGLKRNLTIVVLLLILATFLFNRQPYNPLYGNNGFGLMKHNLKAASFLKNNNAKGLIFNNYDIGGYLIFNLFPKYKVFVDNRPEAYSVSFFKNIYIPMQENEEIWRKYENKYHFQIIFFFRLDMTPWAQPFLIRRIQDKSWIPVYTDDFTLILIKNNGLNANIIQRYELPESMFIVTE